MISNVLLRKVAEGLKVLCVEDNDELRAELAETLGFFFDNVQTAFDGVDAMEKIENERFDIIITDVRMPRMNGIELITKCKSSTHKPEFVVISAHGNDKDMFDLLGLGISKFIPKPISSTILKQALYEVCRNIDDFNITNFYIDELSKTTITLASKVEELESTKLTLERTISTLEVKIGQINKLNAIARNVGVQQNNAAPSNSESALKVEIDDVDFEINQEDLEEILELESLMDSTISMSAISKNMTEHQVEVLAKQLLRYSSILRAYLPIEKLSQAIGNLGCSLENNVQRVEERLDRVMIYMESMSFVLIKWRQNLTSMQVDIHYFDASIINDIEMIISLIEGTSVQADEIELF